jgi:hypothetical protein
MFEMRVRLILLPLKYLMNTGKCLLSVDTNDLYIQLLRYDILSWRRSICRTLHIYSGERMTTISAMSALCIYANID